MDCGIWETDRLKLPLLLLWQHANDTQHPDWEPTVRISKLSEENMLIQVEALDSTLKCRAARTYFRASPQAKDVETLTRLYDTLCHETVPLIRIACETSSAKSTSSTNSSSASTSTSTTEECLEHLKHCLREEGFPLDWYDITVTVQQLNETLDCWVAAKTGSPRLKYIRWKVALRSNAKGSILGMLIITSPFPCVVSVVFGETFLENFTGTSFEPELLVLTTDIPERRLWRNVVAPVPYKEYDHGILLKSFSACLLVIRPQKSPM